ncbi:MAG TPA: hypothetical protein VL598_13065 [Trinickia sp.]|jgi:hypothetical protein|uniref:hypothetical protein n=1 Tax=Trinickia sp. TaxID=2571163 RepID=UPI002B60EA81|nr:hypothetical protein [Trinickia sp.]HTI18589.1 hypothetical protein [Trinickia sp.]
MKTAILTYWPLAVAVTLGGLAAAQAYGSKAPHTPLAVEQVGAELARTVSYGLIDDRSALPSPVETRGVSSSELQQAS